MKTYYVKDLQKNQLIENETFAISDCKKSEDKNGKTYYNLVVGDKTGKLNAKIWSDNLAYAQTNAIKNGKVVKIAAKVDEYKGSLQLNILSLEGVDETSLDEFLESSEFDADEMMNELMAEVDAMKSKDIQKLIHAIFADKEIERRYKYWPAAKSVHHDFRSGLLQHVLEMITISKGLERFYPNINYDVLLAGIILHDIGKVEELAMDGVGVTYTKKGMLLGHISIGAELISRFKDKSMPEDLFLHITHLILSHHGTLQFGSPIVPSTVEAIMLTYIDNLSAKARTATSQIKSIPEGEDFSNFINWLENARLWNFKMPQSSNPDLTDDDKDGKIDQMSLV